MKILVTGGSGLIGCAIHQVIQNKNDSNNWVFLSSKDCDLLDIDKTREVFKSHAPDYIIHLAANVGGLFKNMNQKVQMLESNLLINFNVLKVAHELDINSVMCCLSTCVFPDKVTYPIDESQLHNGAPHDSNYGYAHAKRLLDIHCRVYREQYKRNYFCIVPTNVYGPNDNYNLEDSHVIPGLIHKCYLAKQTNQPFYIKGTGKPLRQFIYSLDIAKCIYHLVFNYQDSKSVILSVGEKEEVSIRDVALSIAKHMGYSNVQFQTEFSDGQYKKTVNNDYLVSLMPADFKFTPLNEGIKESVQWFCQNYEIARK